VPPTYQALSEKDLATLIENLGAMSCFLADSNWIESAIK